MTDYDVLMKTLKARYSCRAFRPDRVPRAQIEQIIVAARQVPSWCNAQPWHVNVTSGLATEAFRVGLKAAAQQSVPALDLGGPDGYPGVYGERRRACGWQLYDAVGVQKGDRAASHAQMMRNFDLFDAPHVAVVSSPRALGAYGAMDTGGFVAAFTLAAKSLGVDTIAQASIANFPDFVRAHFGLDKDHLIVCAISFGYQDKDHPANSFRTPRARADTFLEWHE